MTNGGRAVVLGAGQVGTYVARALGELGFFVAAADVKPDLSFFYRFGPAEERAALVGLDLHDRTAVGQLLADQSPCAALVLCAGLSGRRALARPGEARRLYRDGTTNVLEAARECGVARLIFVSSLAVYGASAGAETIREDHLAAPVNDYGEALHEAESIVLSSAGDGIERIVVRSAGVYGPNRFGMGSHSARFFERIVYSAARGEPIVVHGTWEDSDDYIYSKDLGRGIALAATAPVGTDETTFNLASGSVSSLREVAEAVRAVFPTARIAVEKPPDGRPRRRVALDGGRARQTFGFVPRFSLAAGLADYASTVGLLDG